jgi:hypothetical protein
MEGVGVIRHPRFGVRLIRRFYSLTFKLACNPARMPFPRRREVRKPFFSEQRWHRPKLIQEPALASPPDWHDHPTSASANFGIEAVFYVRPREARPSKHNLPLASPVQFLRARSHHQTGAPRIRLVGRGINVVAA